MQKTIDTFGSTLINLDNQQMATVRGGEDLGDIIDVLRKMFGVSTPPEDDGNPERTSL